MAIKKSKGKEWFSVISPEMFGGKEIGKTPASEPEHLINRVLSLSAVEFMDDSNKYHLKFNFRIVKLEDKKAITEFEGSECMQDYISRMVLRRVRRIDSIQDIVTKDGIKIRVKSLATISKKAASTVEKTVRVVISELVKKDVENMTLEDFIGYMISNDLKTKVLKEVRSIYPVRNFEIRKTEVLRK